MAFGARGPVISVGSCARLRDSLSSHLRPGWSVGLPTKLPVFYIVKLAIRSRCNLSETLAFTTSKPFIAPR